MRKGKTRKIFVFVIIFCFILTSILVFVPKGETPILEDPIAEKPDPTKPVDPVEPAKPETPTEPIKLSPVRFEKPDYYEYWKTTDPTTQVDFPILLCRFSTEAVRTGSVEVTLAKDATVYGGVRDSITGESSLTLEWPNLAMIICGINLTQELQESFATKVIPEDIEVTLEMIKDLYRIELKAGTLLGTVGAPLLNDWAGANLIIVIVSDNNSSIEDALTNLMTAL